ncbi:MAG: hypothetical protein LHV69_05050 [Elusimicrobia bacterium]|nr:hypothetical protein [Candidatus Obscuribacterium magneticum]
MLAITSILVGISLRLTLASVFYGNYDQWSWDIVADLIHRGKNVYLYTDRYRYTPLWAYLLALFNKGAFLTGLPLHTWVRGFLTLVDINIAVLLGLIHHQISSSKNWKSSYIYLLNPVAILLTGYHGQFDNLAILPLLLAVYIYSRQRHSPPFLTLWILGTLSLTIKHITTFGVWMFFVYISPTYRRAFLLMACSAAVFLLSLFPCWWDAHFIIMRRILFSQGAHGLYGLGKFLPLPVGKVTFLCLMTLLPVFTKEFLKLPLLKAMEFSFVAFLALTYMIGEQYFILPIIWGSLFHTPWYWIFTVSAALFLVGSPNNIHVPWVPSHWNMVWVTALIWFSTFLIKKASWSPSFSKGKKVP